MQRILLIAMLAVALSACARNRVATQPDLPPLAAPPPPPRVVTPADVTEPETANSPAGGETGSERTAPTRMRKQAPTVRPKPAEVPPPAKPEISPPVQNEQQPPPQPVKTLQMQTPPSGAQADMERQAKTLIGQAKKDLANVKPQLLNSDGQAQLQAATRFVEQATQALTEKNYVLAVSLADKAATIAAVLVAK